MFYSDTMFPTMYDEGIYLFGRRFFEKNKDKLKVKVNGGKEENIKQYYKGEIKEIEIIGKIKNKIKLI